MFGTNPVSLCLYLSVRCCARQKHYESIRSRKFLNKLGVVFLTDSNYSQSFTSSTTIMRDYNNGSVKNDNIQEQSADRDKSQVCNGR